MAGRIDTLSPLPPGAPAPLRGMLPRDIEERFSHLGITSERARRLFAAAVGNHPRELAEVRGISRAAMAAVLGESSTALPEVMGRRKAADGFAKYLLGLRDGTRVEAVWIPLERPRAALCLSSMVGCPLRCAFCATGGMGFSRSLEADEIVGQFLRLRAESPRPVTGALFMGMGEPLLNYDAVMRAAYVLSHPGGGGVNGRNITISTAGVVPAIRRFTAEGHSFRLIVSLTAASSGKRRLLMPHEDTWPLDELADAIREHARATRRRFTVAWVMIRGVNTGREDAEDLARLLRGVPLIVSLIDVQDASGRFLPPGDEERAAFRDALTEILRQPVIRRYSGGAEIGAACGMLTAGAAPSVPAP